MLSHASTSGIHATFKRPLPQAMDRIFQRALSSAGPDADFAALTPLFGAKGNAKRRLPGHANV